MTLKRIPIILIALFCLTFTLVAQAQQTRTYNTVKTKLAAGKQVVGGTITTSDPDIYCAVANSGFDFLWIEMLMNSFHP